MTFAGQSQTRLTTNIGTEGPPAVSRDGTKIAFFRNGAAPGIYTMDSNGAGETRIRAMSSAGGIVFSPDGTRLAFINTDSAIGATSEIFFMNVDGSGLVRFTTGAFANPAGLSWSPDGSRIAFVSFTPTPGVYLVNTAGGPRTRIVNGDEPAFAPSGTRILFRRLNPTSRYYESNLDGSSEALMLNLSGVTRAAYHPDGIQLIFSRATPRSQIYIVSGQGQVTNLSNNAFEDTSPSVRGSP